MNAKVLPYINIHTHHAVPDFVVGIRNVFPEDFEGLEHTVKELPKAYPNYFSIGIHPWNIKEDNQWHKQLEILERYITATNFLAVGEAGLDKAITTDIKLQTDVFVAQIYLSEQYRKPMIIHCVRAYDEILRINKQLKPKMTWIIHGYNSSVEMAMQLTNQNIMLSFGKSLFNPSSKASDVIQKLSDGKYFLETDDDKTLIEAVYQRGADLRKTSIEDLKIVQNNNFRKVFGG